MRGKQRGFSILLGLVPIFILMACLLTMGTVAFGEEETEKKDLPPRGISIAPDYTGVVADVGDGVSIDVKVYNKGRQDENIKLIMASIPEGWDAWIKTYNYKVTGVHVPSDDFKSLTLRAEPDEGTGPGVYTFRLEAQTDDGRLTSSVDVTIKTVEKVKEEKKVEGLEITTSYPVLQGPTDAKFEFSIDVKSKVDKDSIFNLSAQGPENWDINFKPAYETKYISSLRIKSNGSQTMAVEVKPYPFAEPGEYKLKVKVDSPVAHGEVDLEIILTGTYKMEIGTADGRLSLNAMQGKAANLSFYVKNSGSAAQSNVRFLSFKPENWKVEFNPEKITELTPGALKQVEATITPADQALVGDYSVGISVEGEKGTKNMEMRVTVKASTLWGWIGILIIVIVILGLVVMFIKLGRR